MKRLQIFSLALLTAVPLAGVGLINSAPTQAYPIEQLTLSEESEVNSAELNDPDRHRGGRYRYHRGGRYRYHDGGRYRYHRGGRYRYDRGGRYRYHDGGRYRYHDGGRYRYGRYDYGRFARYVIFGGFPASTIELPSPMIEIK